MFQVWQMLGNYDSIQTLIEQSSMQVPTVHFLSHVCPTQMKLKALVIQGFEQKSSVGKNCVKFLFLNGLLWVLDLIKGNLSKAYLK